MIKSVVIIGAGNVATHLAHAFYQLNLNIKQIISTSSSAKELAQKVNASYSTNISDIKSADLCLIAVGDDNIKTVVQSLQFDYIVVHTSGSQSMDLLSKFTNYGVFYPLQTFSPYNPSFDFSNIPICLESNKETIQNELDGLARLLSQNVITLNSIQRQKAHLSAVIANNFSNHFFHLASEYLQANNIDGNIITPLIQKTTNNLIRTTAFNAQTGPAKRNDQTTIDSHLALLDKHPELQNLYKLVSQNISKTYNELSR